MDLPFLTTQRFNHHPLPEAFTRAKVAAEEGFA